MYLALILCCLLVSREGWAWHQFELEVGAPAWQSSTRLVASSTALLLVSYNITTLKDVLEIWHARLPACAAVHCKDRAKTKSDHSCAKCRAIQACCFLELTSRTKDCTLLGSSHEGITVLHNHWMITDSTSGESYCLEWQILLAQLHSCQSHRMQLLWLRVLFGHDGVSSSSPVISFWPLSTSCLDVWVLHKSHEP